ncbi:MAG: ammonia-forming cytochrome c nitrite reductase subunit c552 [Eggerthella lenta]
MNSQVCGQCHNDTTSMATRPRRTPTRLDQMTRDAILAYYDERNFKDWNHADTFAPMIKVQHPEFETMHGGEQSPMAKAGYGCPTATWPPLRARTASTRRITG